MKAKLFFVLFILSVFSTGAFCQQTGYMPYSGRYGSTNSVSNEHHSVITVTAPNNSDVLVMVKNSSSSVVRHAYIVAGHSYSFNVANGRYETFFYYGTDWSRQKEMSNGLLGGFLRNEAFSRSGYESLNDMEVTYVLKLTINGNFNTISTSESNMFN